MPYKSRAQQRKFHAMQDRDQIDPSTVSEFDQASQGMKLPDRAASKKGQPPPPKKRAPSKKPPSPPRRPSRDSGYQRILKDVNKAAKKRGWNGQQP